MNQNENQSERGNEELLWNSQYWKVMVSNFMLFFAFYLLTPLLPLYLDSEFAADKDTIGIVLSGYVVATFLIRPFSGFMVDSFNRKTVLMVCFFTFFLCFAGYLGASTLLMFAIVRTMHGIPFGAATVANSTVAIDVLPSSRRAEGIGYYGLSNNLAMAIAPSAGIYLYKYTGSFEILFWISLIIAFIGFLCSSTVKIPRKILRKSRPHMDLDHFFLTRAWLMAINICLFGLCWGVMSNYVALFGQQELGITDGTGIFFAILSVGLVLSRLTGHKALRQGRMTSNCTQGVMLSLAGYVLFALTLNEYTYYASALLIGLGNGRMYPAFLNIFVRVARHDQRGTANSSILISWDFGMGLGILLGGIVAEYVSFSAAFWAVAATQAAGALMFILFTRYFYERRALPDL